MRFWIFVVLAALVTPVVPVLAADNPAPAAPASSPAAASAPSTAPAPAPAIDPADLEKRTALATKMHALRPTRDQVWSAIDEVAQMQPADQRPAFINAMRAALNYNAIEKISIDAMAETYTAAELQAMVDFYSRPEAISAAAKERQYSAKVYPEIMRMLDQAMMKIRTGGDSSAPAAPAARAGDLGKN